VKSLLHAFVPRRGRMLVASLFVLLALGTAVVAARRSESQPADAASLSPATLQAKQTVAAVDSPVRLCQALSPAAPHCISGVDCANGRCGELGWKSMGPIPWGAFAQGEYVGHARTRHVADYRIRVDDLLEFIYRETRNKSTTPYELEVGDQIRIESLTAPELNRELIIQPDGTITVLLLGQVAATGRTVADLREQLEEVYKKFYKEPSITVTPLQVNTRLVDLLASVDARAGRGGQRVEVRVTPEGTVQLPGIGSVLVQGLNLDEVELEVEARYSQIVVGIGVTPVLRDRAPRFVYVLGEVGAPGRFVLEGPTTAMQSIALAGSWRVGANLRQVIVFRRGDDWRLKATMLDVRGALYGRRPCPADEIWLNDSDIVVVPKTPINIANDVIEQVFTRGIYSVFPLDGVNWGLRDLTRLRP